VCVRMLLTFERALAALLSFLVVVCVYVCVCVLRYFRILKWMRLLSFDFVVIVCVCACWVIFEFWEGSGRFFLIILLLCTCVYVCQDAFHIHMCMYTFMLGFNNKSYQKNMYIHVYIHAVYCNNFGSILKSNTTISEFDLVFSQQILKIHSRPRREKDSWTCRYMCVAVCCSALQWNIHEIVDVFMCEYVDIFISVYLCVFLNLWMYLYVNVHIYIYLCRYIYMCAHVNMLVCMYVQINMWMACKYICMYVCTYVPVCTYVRACIFAVHI